MGTGQKGLRAMVGLAAVCAIFSGAAACARYSGQAAGQVAPAGSVTVHVRNQNFLDMDVFAVVDGFSRRLGTVTGNTTQDFILNPDVVASREVRILATPVGGAGRASTGALTIAPGDLIDFTIAADLPQSSVIIR